MEKNKLDAQLAQAVMSSDTPFPQWRAAAIKLFGEGGNHRAKALISAAILVRRMLVVERAITHVEDSDSFSSSIFAPRPRIYDDEQLRLILLARGDNDLSLLATEAITTLAWILSAEKYVPREALIGVLRADTMLENSTIIPPVSSSVAGVSEWAFNVQGFAKLIEDGVSSDVAIELFPIEMEAFEDLRATRGYFRHIIALAQQERASWDERSAS